MFFFFIFLKQKDLVGYIVMQVWWGEVVGPWFLARELGVPRVVAFDVAECPLVGESAEACFIQAMRKIVTQVRRRTASAFVVANICSWPEVFVQRAAKKLRDEKMTRRVILTLTTIRGPAQLVLLKNLASSTRVVHQRPRDQTNAIALVREYLFDQEALSALARLVPNPSALPHALTPAQRVAVLEAPTVTEALKIFELHGSGGRSDALVPVRAAKRWLAADVAAVVRRACTPVDCKRETCGHNANAYYPCWDLALGRAVSEIQLGIVRRTSEDEDEDDAAAADVTGGSYSDMARRVMQMTPKAMRTHHPPFPPLAFVRNRYTLLAHEFVADASNDTLDAVLDALDSAGSLLADAFQDRVWRSGVQEEMAATATFLGLRVTERRGRFHRAFARTPRALEGAGRLSAVRHPLRLHLVNTVLLPRIQERLPPVAPPKGSSQRSEGGALLDQWLNANAEGGDESAAGQPPATEPPPAKKRKLVVASSSSFTKLRSLAWRLHGCPPIQARRAAEEVIQWLTCDDRTFSVLTQPPAPDPRQWREALMERANTARRLKQAANVTASWEVPRPSRVRGCARLKEDADDAIFWGVEVNDLITKFSQ